MLLERTGTTVAGTEAQEWEYFRESLDPEEHSRGRWIVSYDGQRVIATGIFINTEPCLKVIDKVLGDRYARAPWINPREIENPFDPINKTWNTPQRSIR